jgi:hypothetical protein
MTNFLVATLTLLCALLALSLHRALVRVESTSIKNDLLQEMRVSERRHIEALEARIHIAQERLVSSWKDGYTVPSAPELEEEHASEAPILTASQEEWLDQWEDAETRQRWAQFLLRRHRAGRTQDAALADAELELVGGRERLMTPQATSGLVIG